jgi:hypothetical protein
MGGTELISAIKSDEAIDRNGSFLSIAISQNGRF